VNDNKIINAAFIDREAFNEISRYIKDDFTGPAEILWEEVVEFYKVDSSATRCDGEIVLARIGRKYPKIVENLTTVIKGFSEVSIGNIIKEVADYKRQITGLELSSALISDNKISIRDLLYEYSNLSQGILDDNSNQDRDVAVSVNSSLDDLTVAYATENLIKVYPKSLNDKLGGGVVPGTNIGIMARPEVAKTLFAINMAAGFCAQGLRTMYVGNEDSMVAMRTRLVSRMSGMGRFDILKYPDKALERARQQGYEHLIYVDASPGTLSIIEGLIQEYNPKCLIVDQVRNIIIPGDTGLVQILEKVASGIRSLGKRYDLVTVQVTQAGDSASDKLILTMSDIDNSKTGFPAAFDVLIGIGMNSEYENSNRRHISLCKNKINNNHENFPVVIDPNISKVMN